MNSETEPEQEQTGRAETLAEMAARIKAEVLAEMTRRYQRSKADPLAQIPVLDKQWQMIEELRAGTL